MPPYGQSQRQYGRPTNMPPTMNAPPITSMWNAPEMRNRLMNGIPLADDESAADVHLPAAERDVQPPAGEQDREPEVDVRQPAQRAVEPSRAPSPA